MAFLRNGFARAPLADRSFRWSGSSEIRPSHMVTRGLDHDRLDEAVTRFSRGGSE